MVEELEVSAERKTKRQLREDEFVSLWPQLQCDPSQFSDVELDGLISFAIRKADQERPRRHRRLR